MIGREKRFRSGLERFDLSVAERIWQRLVVGKRPNATFQSGKSHFLWFTAFVRYNSRLARPAGQDEMNRSEQRIPKLRTRGRENRRRLLAEAERLLLESSDNSLRFCDVFAAAGVSRGSAYRIYIGVDDLLQDLATEWINNLADYLMSMQLDTEPEDWAHLSDLIVRRGAEYWASTANTLRVLPRIRSNVPESYKDALRTMSDCLSRLFNRYFEMPDVPAWRSKLAFFTQICDITFADAVRREGYISDERRTEAEVLCRTYLAMHLPAWLPARGKGEPRSS